jgi:hypothetical protein
MTLRFVLLCDVWPWKTLIHDRHAKA